jgi:DNA-directed RNA polymerase subunit N (RpoN/RPB10)
MLLHLTGRIPWFERDDVLPACQQDSAERHHVHLANGVTDDSKSILSDLTVRRYVVRRIDIALVDLALRNEPMVRLLSSCAALACFRSAD